MGKSTIKEGEKNLILMKVSHELLSEPQGQYTKDKDQKEE